MWTPQFRAKAGRKPTIFDIELDQPCPSRLRCDELLLLTLISTWNSYQISPVTSPTSSSKYPQPLAKGASESRELVSTRRQNITKLCLQPLSLIVEACSVFRTDHCRWQLLTVCHDEIHPWRLASFFKPAPRIHARLLGPCFPWRPSNSQNGWPTRIICKNSEAFSRCFSVRLIAGSSPQWPKSTAYYAENSTSTIATLVCCRYSNKLPKEINYEGLALWITAKLIVNLSPKFHFLNALERLLEAPELNTRVEAMAEWIDAVGRQLSREADDNHQEEGLAIS